MQNLDSAISVSSMALYNNCNFKNEFTAHKVVITISMAESTLFRCTARLFLLLSLVLLLESLKTCPRDTYAATLLSMTLNLDVTQFPRRRTSPYTAR